MTLVQTFRRVRDAERKDGVSHCKAASRARFRYPDDMLCLETVSSGQELCALSVQHVFLHSAKGGKGVGEKRAHLEKDSADDLRFIIAFMTADPARAHRRNRKALQEFHKSPA